jgi:hypothetical protein
MPLYIVLCGTICSQVFWSSKGLNRSFLMKFKQENLRTRKLCVKSLTKFIYTGMKVKEMGPKQANIVMNKYQNKKWNQHIFHCTYLEIKIIFHVHE